MLKLNLNGVLEGKENDPHEHHIFSEEKSLPHISYIEFERQELFKKDDILPYNRCLPYYSYINKFRHIYPKCILQISEETWGESSIKTSTKKVEPLNDYQKELLKALRIEYKFLEEEQQEDNSDEGEVDIEEILKLN